MQNAKNRTNKKATPWGSLILLFRYLAVNYCPTSWIIISIERANKIKHNISILIERFYFNLISTFINLFYAI